MAAAVVADPAVDLVDEDTPDRSAVAVDCSRVDIH